MKRVLVLLLAAPIAACGYTVEYKGQVADEVGSARAGLSVTLADVGYADGRYTDRDVVARATNKEAAITDADGRFSLAHDYGNGLGGCGIDFQPVLIVAEGGEAGAVAVLPVRDDESARSVDVGHVRMLGALDASADDAGVYVAFPALGGGRRQVVLDGQRWFVDDAGVLPREALFACPRTAPCAHLVAAVLDDVQLHLRSQTVSLQVTAPVPAALLDSSSDGSILSGARLARPIAARELYLDLLGGAAALTDDAVPTVRVATDALGLELEALPREACTVYGSGLRCAAPEAALTRVSVEGARAHFQVRVFAR